jgi:hypothetical protein
MLSHMRQQIAAAERGRKVADGWRKDRLPR